MVAGPRTSPSWETVSWAASAGMMSCTSCISSDLEEAQGPRQRWGLGGDSDASAALAGPKEAGLHWSPRPVVAVHKAHTQPLKNLACAAGRWRALCSHLNISMSFRASSGRSNRPRSAMAIALVALQDQQPPPNRRLSLTT